MSPFEQQVSVFDLPWLERLRRARHEGTVGRERESISEEPGPWRPCGQLGISRSSLQRILKELHLFLYKIQLVQELKTLDFRERLAFAVRFQQLSRNENGYVHLNGFNRQSCRIWGPENPRVINQHQLHPLKCTAKLIIGPYFFEDVEGNALRATGERYRGNDWTFSASQNRSQTRHMVSTEWGHCSHCRTNNGTPSSNIQWPINFKWVRN